MKVVTVVEREQYLKIVRINSAFLLLVQFHIMTFFLSLHLGV